METVLRRVEKCLEHDLLAALMMLGYRLARDGDAQTGAFIALAAGRIPTLEALSAGRYSSNNRRAGK